MDSIVNALIAPISVLIWSFLTEEIIHLLAKGKYPLTYDTQKYEIDTSTYIGAALGVIMIAKQGFYIEAGVLFATNIVVPIAKYLVDWRREHRQGKERPKTKFEKTDNVFVLTNAILTLCFVWGIIFHTAKAPLILGSLFAVFPFVFFTNKEIAIFIIDCVKKYLCTIAMILMINTTRMKEL